MKLETQRNPELYSLERMFIVVWGINHLAYGTSPQEAFNNLVKRFQ